MAEPRTRSELAPELIDTLLVLGRPDPGIETHPLSSAPLLAAVRGAGTTHIYADTADVDELRKIGELEAQEVIAEIDGNTANQPLVHKVVERHLGEGPREGWAARLKEIDESLSEDELVRLVYAAILGRVGNRMAGSFASGRVWEVSLQLHMALGEDAEASKRTGRLLRRMVPSAFVKVPFTPQHPHCFFIARDLEREGIPVNFTSTFSARQAVLAAILADVARTNVFMGRINQGLGAGFLGEHVSLEAQRALLRLRRDEGLKTQLIVASVRDWRTFVRLAGCDVFTAPCAAIAGLLEQLELRPEDITPRTETSYEDCLDVDPEAEELLGKEAIARLYRVEPELVEFATELRHSREYPTLQDGDELYRIFDRAGFGDIFYSPAEEEWTELRKEKLPDLRSSLSQDLPLDTLYTLLADADFEKHQEEIDAAIRKRL